MLPSAMRHVSRRSGLVAWVGVFACASTLSVSACQSHGSDEGQAEGRASDRDGGSAPAPDDRIPTLDAPAVGLAPGYVEGALLYASWRAGVMQELLRSLPVSPDEARDMAELGAVLGVDPRLNGMLAHLGIDPNARISMSVRPVTNWAADVRSAIQSQSPALSELTGSGANRVIPEQPPAASPIVSPPDPIPPGWTPPVAPPPPEQVQPPAPLSPAARELDRKSRSLGVHVRLHVPSVAPQKLDTLITNVANEIDRVRWATTCAALGPTRVCGGASDHVVVVRDVAGGVQLDMLLTFFSDYEAPDDEFRRALIQEALSVPVATSLPAVESLRGDAVLLVDGPAAITALRALAVAWQVVDMRDDGDSSSRRRERDAAIRSLHETERMFQGVTLEVSTSGDTVLARGRWLPTEFGRQHMAEVFELTNIDADVPSIASLCDGALLCGRSRGAPDRARFAQLATGVYSQPKQLAELLDDHEEDAAAILLLESWPNAIGTAALLPGTLVEPPESLIVQNVIDIGSRVLGLGFSVRSLRATHRSVTGDWVAYARTSAADLTAVRGFLQMAEARFAPASIPEVDGRVEFTPLPDDDLPGNYYALYDPHAVTGDWGWAMIADGDDRVRWLAGREHDDGSAPLVYLEVVDLWRLVSAFDDEARELGFAQSWLSGRWVRGQVALTNDGAPELRMAMGKVD
jgi:hypothetical protein